MAFNGKHTRHIIQLFADVFADTLELTPAAALRGLGLMMDQCPGQLCRQRRTFGLLLGFGVRRQGLCEFGQLGLDGSFAPILIPEHERCFTGFDDKIIAMYARGMTVREIRAFLAEQYGTDVSHDFISSATYAVLDEISALGSNGPWSPCTQSSSSMP